MTCTVVVRDTDVKPTILGTCVSYLLIQIVLIVDTSLFNYLFIQAGKLDRKQLFSYQGV